MSRGRSHVWNGLRAYVESGGTLDLVTAQKIIARVFRSLGITMQPGSAACRGVSERAIQNMLRAGDLAEAGDGFYIAPTMTVLAESGNFALGQSAYD